MAQGNHVTSTGNGSAPDGPPRRILFLDDDPERATRFHMEVPHAVWVSTAAECLEKLKEYWDEIHLEHDLGGEILVDCARQDCGMEIVRTLSLEPHPHLKSTYFYVHSHNGSASEMMVMQLRAAGYQVEARPFGRGPIPQGESGPRVEPYSQARPHEQGFSGWLHAIRRYVFGTSKP